MTHPRPEDERPDLLDAMSTEEQDFWDARDAEACDDDLPGDWPNEDSEVDDEAIDDGDLAF